MGFGTAVAQAELEDRERPGAYHRLRFHGPDDEPVYIETTRPELLPACVALVAHPDDERYAHLFGGTVRTPVFGVEVPVHAHPLAEKDKGSGIAMVCTFGDLADVTWWRELRLRHPGGDRPRRAAAARAAARRRPGEIRAAGRAAPSTRRGGRSSGCSPSALDLIGEPRPVTHPVKFYERGDSPLEIVSTRQWYIRNGGRDADLRAALLDRGRELHWVPPHMRHRYEHWVGGLTGRLAGQPAAVLRRADAGLVPAGRRRPSRTTTTRWCPPKTGSRSTRPRTCRPAIPRSSGACRAGSPATPTCSTPGPPPR